MKTHAAFPLWSKSKPAQEKSWRAVRPPPWGVGYPLARRVLPGGEEGPGVLAAPSQARLLQDVPEALPGVPARASPCGSPGGPVPPGHSARPALQAPQIPISLTAGGHQGAEQADQQQREGGPASHGARGAAQEASREWGPRMAVAAAAAGVPTGRGPGRERWRGAPWPRPGLSSPRPLPGTPQRGPSAGERTSGGGLVTHCGQKGASGPLHSESGGLLRALNDPRAAQKGASDPLLPARKVGAAYPPLTTPGRPGREQITPSPPRKWGPSLCPQPLTGSTPPRTPK